MRICILGDAGSIHVRRIAGGLARRMHCVCVVSHKPGEIPGVTVERFAVPPLGWRHPLGWSRRRQVYLKGIMRAHDVVHVNFLNDWSLTRRIIDNGRLVVTPWGSDIIKPPDLDAYPHGIPQMRRDLLQMADMVLVYGRWFVETVADFGGIPPERIVSVPLGVDLNLFKPRSAGPAGPPVIGFFKGFKPVYGPTVLMAAIPRVLKRVPQARFEMVGSGPLLEECRRMAKQAAVEEVVSWVGRMMGEDMPEVIGRWTLSVMPSFSESFCVAALESSAMEVPVVASKVGGLQETVRDGKTGLLVPPGDPDALAAAVVDLLEDPARRKAMGKAGRTMVAAEYERESCLSKLETAYHQVVESVRV